jgi:hypothetical protein
MKKTKTETISIFHRKCSDLAPEREIIPDSAKQILALQ